MLFFQATDTTCYSIDFLNSKGGEWIDFALKSKLLRQNQIFNKVDFSLKIQLFFYTKFTIFFVDLQKRIVLSKWNR